MFRIFVNYLVTRILNRSLHHDALLHMELGRMYHDRRGLDSLLPWLLFCWCPLEAYAWSIME